MMYMLVQQLIVKKCKSTLGKHLCRMPVIIDFKHIHHTGHVISFIQIGKLVNYRLFQRNVWHTWNVIIQK